MPQNLLVVIGAGALPELQMSAACQSLADAFGAVLLEEGCGRSPHPLLSEITSETGDSSRLILLRLSGDVGVDESGEGSWMEALAGWRIPVLMLAHPRLTDVSAGSSQHPWPSPGSSNSLCLDWCSSRGNGMLRQGVPMDFPGVAAFKGLTMTQGD